MEQAAYQITIKTTADKAAASTSADVFIQLVGEDGSYTDWEKLTSFWRRYFREGNTDNFDLTLKDIGFPIIARLKLENKKDEAESWGCDFVTVQYKNQTEEFPVYDWVYDSIDVARGKATLPQHVTNDHVKDSRCDERQRNEAFYQWIGKTEAHTKNWRQGRYMDFEKSEDLPPILQYEDAKWDAYKSRRKHSRVNAIINKIKSFFGGITELDQYNAYHERLIIAELPSSHERWNQDEEFGRQMINGNSRSIKKCDGLPDYCNITDGHLKGLMPEGTTLRDEIAENRVFIVDHTKATAGITRNDQNGKQQLYCADPMAVFHSRNESLLPLAIQLEPNNAESIFTPNDTEYDWLLAKMYFRNADFSVHEWMEHFRVHTVIEPLTISMFRNLPRAHPIYKLMRIHLWNIPVANQRGRDFFFGTTVPAIFRSQDGLEMTNKGFALLDFNDLNFPKTLEKRGLMDAKTLPSYYLRDDALLYWNAIEKFAGQMINHFYKSDEDVRQDNELQAWINEAVVEGYLYDEGLSSTCPRSFETIQELHNFITTIIFHVSVYHAIVHFPQYEMFKFIPNAPAGMRLPIHKKGEGSLQRVLDSLPTMEMSIIQVSVSYIATRFGPNEVLLGEYPMRLFTESDVHCIMEEFAADIQEVGRKIRERNKGRTVPNEYLVPERIPASILG